MKMPIEKYGWQQDKNNKNRYSKPTNVIIGGYISTIDFGKKGITLSIQHRDIPPEEILAIYKTFKQIKEVK